MLAKCCSAGANLLELGGRMRAQGFIWAYSLLTGVFLGLVVGSGNLGAQKNKGENTLTEGSCNDPTWCSIPAPQTSFYGFKEPIQRRHWDEARLKAMSGEQVLLKQVIRQFPHYLDFLDGDTKFRKYHYLADFFIDRNNDLSPLINDHLVEAEQKPRKPYKWGKTIVLQRNQDFYYSKRAPIVKAGYYAFAQPHSLFYGGPELGKAVVSRSMLLEYWRNVKDMIKRPFIVLDVHDENWGILSTEFHNRTKNWGSCCSPEETKALHEFLDHNMTLLWAVGQHHNFTHPKIISLPRGLPLSGVHGGRIIWDTMRSVLLANKPKNKLVYTAATASGHRVRLFSCIRAKFPPEDFSAVDLPGEENLKRRDRMGPLEYRRDYYENVATARVGIALPGIGYDTYRLWELLTMGTVAVIERGVGLDRTVWKLPVLLVDDFSQVTPQLLRAAYVEAIYRAEAGQFEFQRLTQSYWYSFLMNVSRSRSTDTVLQHFPLEAQDVNFARPAVPYTCTDAAGRRLCGEGTKRTPAEYC